MVRAVLSLLPLSRLLLQQGGKGHLTGGGGKNEIMEELRLISTLFASSHHTSERGLNELATIVEGIVTLFL